MIILGWLVLTLGALWILAGGFISMYVSFGFSGRADPVSWFFIVVSALMLLASYANFPFVVVLK